MAWPSIARRPKSETVETQDNSVRHSTEDSSVIRRRRFTRDTYIYKVSYDLLPTTDAGAILALYNTNNMFESFIWIDKNAVSHTVMFNKPISYVETIPGWYKFDTFEFLEV